MIYLSYFRFLDAADEFVKFIHTGYTNFYPMGVFKRFGHFALHFDPITILYGGNGSGKTTALNVIAETLKLQRESMYNRSSCFEVYTNGCRYKLQEKIPPQSRIITSDDVFDYMLNLRSINSGVDNRRDELFEEYNSKKKKLAGFTRMKSMKDYDKLVEANNLRSVTRSQYVQQNLVDNIRTRSNGENAFMYFTEKIEDGGLYLLDEPENSLEPERQLELKRFIENAARFFNCQFIIATHSPFMLSMKNAKVYDLGENDFSVKHWTQLDNIKTYYSFFKDNEDEFQKHENDPFQKEIVEYPDDPLSKADKELYALLKDVSEKDDFIQEVFECCHSEYDKNVIKRYLRQEGKKASKNMVLELARALNKD